MTTASGTRRSSTRAWMANSLLLIGSVGVSLLLLEGALRVHQWLTYGTTESYIGGQVRFDPEMKILAPVPGFQSNTITINSLGFRGPELAVPKPPGTVRLAFVGGSTTYCSEVSADELAWPHLVTSRLGEIFEDVRFDYINAAVPGYTARFSTTSLRARVERHSPDVIVVYHATNDLASNTRRQATEQGVHQAPEFSWLDLNSRLWIRVKRIVEFWSVQRRADTDPRRLVYDAQLANQQFDDNLTSLLERGRDTGALVAVATFSHRVAPTEMSTPAARYSPGVAMQNMPYMDLKDLTRGYKDFNDVIQRVASRTGALLIGGEERIAPTDVNFTDSFHFTDSGSRLMAERVVDALLTSDAFRSLISAMAEDAREARR